MSKKFRAIIFKDLSRSTRNIEVSARLKRICLENQVGIYSITDVIEYLKFRQDDGKTAYTISKDMAALNKLLNFHVTKKIAGIKQRSYKDITRSREARDYDKKYNPNNYKDQILFAKASGSRRESVFKSHTRTLHMERWSASFSLS